MHGMNGEPEKLGHIEKLSPPFPVERRVAVLQTREGMSKAAEVSTEEETAPSSSLCSRQKKGG